MTLAYLVLTIFLVAAGSTAEERIGYQMPPRAIADIADARPTPDVVVDPMRRWLLVVDHPRLGSIEELARDEYRLAGLRFHPATNARSRRSLADRLTLVSMTDGSERAVTGLPERPHLDHVTFSPDGTRVAFTHTTSAGLELWAADVSTARAARVAHDVNGVFREHPYRWLSTGAMLVKIVPAERGTPPAAPVVPTGPVVRESTGQTAPARTYQDLLENPHDEELFEYYGTSQLVRVDRDGSVHPLGSPAILSSVEPSPDASLVLVEALETPFSYLVPYYRFPTRIVVLDVAGTTVKEIARLPLAENVPVGRNAVRTGAREHGWRADADKTLFWAEARDGGDPRADAKLRDEVFTWDAPFSGEPMSLVKLAYRFDDVYWLNDDVALVEAWWWASRRRRLSRVVPGATDEPPAAVFDYSYEDRYNAPGSPLLQPTSRGTHVLATDGSGRIYLTGEGASPEGNRPFVDAFDLASGERERLFRSEAPHYDTPVEWIDESARVLLTRRESRDEPPNFFARELSANATRRLTEFPHPYPALEDAGRELVRYDRDDGVKLTATLYTPPGWEPSDGPLPMLVWAYPREYKSADAAAQVRDSPHRFARVRWGSPLYWLTQGYAVMEGATMPIVGEGDVEPNDTYVSQLVASARAAVDEAVRRGVADRDRVGIGGHSYGAFMTANLLAHSDVFRAGIARSGAYNRSLTPFGFQSEQRTFWEAPEIYFAMSPFMHADQIDEPILLTHGELDNNSGTFPVQSRRLYHALKGHGAVARLVMLPYESHGYRARESVMHTLWEMNGWLEQYVKNAPPRASTSNDDP